MSQQVLNFKYIKGKKFIHPAHKLVEHWTFTEDTQDEAMLANQIAIIAEKNGLEIDEVSYLFPAILRMLKNDSVFACQNK